MSQNGVSRREDRPYTSYFFSVCRAESFSTTTTTSNRAPSNNRPIEDANSLPFFMQPAGNNTAPADEDVAGPARAGNGVAGRAPVAEDVVEPAPVAEDVVGPAPVGEDVVGTAPVGNGVAGPAAPLVISILDDDEDDAAIQAGIHIPERPVHRTQSTTSLASNRSSASAASSSRSTKSKRGGKSTAQASSLGSKVNRSTLKAMAHSSKGKAVVENVSPHFMILILCIDSTTAFVEDEVDSSGVE